MNRFFIKCFVVVSCILSLEAFHAHATGPLPLQFWHSMTGEKGKLLQHIVSEFNALPENQGKVSVQTQFVGSYEEGLNKLRTALLGGRGPHVVQIVDIGSKMMMDSGVVTPLQNFIDQDADFPLKQLLPAIRRYYQGGGQFGTKMFSLPFATSNPILYYNVDALKKAGIAHPPTTFAELEEDARLLTSPSSDARDARSRTLGLTWPLHSWFFEEFLARAGESLIKPDNGRGTKATEANYLSPAAIEFVTLWSRMVRNGTFANVGRGWDPAEQNFLAGRVAMLITSTSDIFEILKEVPFKLGTAPIPASSATARGGTVVGGNSLWILNNKPANEQLAAYRFLKFMASPAVQREWHMATGYFPIRQDVIDALKQSGFYEKYPQAWTAIAQLLASPETPATQGASMGVFPEAREHIANAIEEVLSGRSDVREALAKAKAKTDFSLMRYNRGRNE